MAFFMPTSHSNSKRTGISLCVEGDIFFVVCCFFPRCSFATRLPLKGKMGWDGMGEGVMQWTVVWYVVVCYDVIQCDARTVPTMKTGGNGIVCVGLWWLPLVLAFQKRIVSAWCQSNTLINSSKSGL